MANRAPWRTTDLAKVRELYPQGGVAACAAALPGRSPCAIYQVANKLGLRRIQARGAVKDRALVELRNGPLTPRILARITSCSLKSAMQALCDLKREGVAERVICYRARRHG